jgi:transcriptional regulator with XRE-family HTH domain
MSREEYFGVPVMLARKLKGISQNGNLTESKIDDLIVSKVKTLSKQIKVSRKALSKYFSDEVTPKERDNVIDKALDNWFKHHPKKTISIDKEKAR